MRRLRELYSLLVLSSLVLCSHAVSLTAQDSVVDALAEAAVMEDTTDERLDATLWIQGSLEYSFASQQAYHLAKQIVAQNLQDTTITAAIEQRGEYAKLPPAVILDVDETVLSNAPFQARIIEKGVEYNDADWATWVHDRKAKVMPGASDFIHFAVEHGVSVFFVTNRTADLEESTIENLRYELRIPISRDQVLCKNEKPEWGSDKSSRRTEICQYHRVLCLVGDEFNDFAFIGKPASAERVRLGNHLSGRFAKDWVILPNPLYGDWEKSLYNYNYELSTEEKRRLKYRALDTAAEPTK